MDTPIVVGYAFGPKKMSTMGVVMAEASGETALESSMSFETSYIFDTLPEDQFADFTPYLQVIVSKEGLLFIVWLLFALVIGGIVQLIGLMKEKFIEKWQGIFIIIGLLLLLNPDIELISSVGSALMCIAYIPWGIKELKRK